MANYKKTFNFRNGVQVDDDNLIVNSAGLVGIGTSVPTELLDVRGTTKVVGLLTVTEATSGNLIVTGIATITTAKIGIVSITSGGIVTATSSTGIVTYYGDGGRLLNLPTSQWVDTDVGLGFTSIYNKGYVGIATNDPRFLLQIGGNNDVTNFKNGVGINSGGTIYATGVVTAYSFVGYGTNLTGLNASNITNGTIDNAYLPTIDNSKLPVNINLSGIITASGGFKGILTGNVVGIATTAIDLLSTSNVSINSIVSGFSSCGISTVKTRLDVTGTVGIGTTTHRSNLHIVNANSGISSIQLTSPTESTITLGRSLDQLSNNAGLKFGNTIGLYPYSTTKSLDIINYDLGNVNHYLHYGTSTGINTGGFNWIYSKDATNPLMSLTYKGNLGIGFTNPVEKLKVAGITSITGNLFVDQNVYVKQNLTIYDTIIDNDLKVSGTATFASLNGTLSGNVNSTAGISTFNDINLTGNLEASGSSILNVSKIGIQTSGTTALSDIQVGVNSNTIYLDSTHNSFPIIGIGTDNALTEFDARHSYGLLYGLTIGLETAADPYTPIAIIDFSNAGNSPLLQYPGANTKRFMVPPKLTTTQRNAQSPVEGGVIYNTTLHRLEVYNGTGWCGIATIP